ncbi:hypothetical protein KSS87_009005 [Heliosperma pusillum]|nr:hypothetical protein KSS87_009005 [Heliosperma pusillum]
MAYRFFCRRQGPNGDYCVTVRAGKLCLALPNNSDANQLWYKENCRCGFMLINKATNKATRHCGVGDQLYLVDKPCYVDQSVLWTESIDLGCGFRSFRPLNNNGLGMDAWNGIIFDGTMVSLYPNSVCNQLGENAQWKLVPVSCPTPPPTHIPTPAPTPVYKQPSNMIYCLAGDAQYCVAIKAGKIVLANPNPNPKDTTQQWYKDDSQNTKAGSFMLVNKSNFQAAKQSSADQPLQLVNRPTTPDNSFLWTESETDGYGFTFLVTANNNGLAMNARSGDGKGAHDDKYLSYSRNLKGDNQKWKFIP